MSVDDRIQQIADHRAGELIHELHGSTFHELPVRDQVTYKAEVSQHIADWLKAELVAATETIACEQPNPGEWADQRERDAAAQEMAAR